MHARTCAESSSTRDRHRTSGLFSSICEHCQKGRLIKRMQGMQTGACQCGEVRYESVGGPSGLYVCHCRECQKQSSSAFGISFIVPRAGFRVTQGVPRFWVRATDSGGQPKCAFCPNCGSRLWHEPEGGSETVSVKGGTLDKLPDISSAIHIWTSSKLPGIDIPTDVQQYSEEPD